MNSININPDHVHAVSGGHEGENGVTVFVFDLSAWINRYGPGSVYIDGEKPDGTIT